MEVRDFLYWVRGYFELNGHSRLNKYQLSIIKEHLQLVSSNKATMSEDDKHFLAHIYHVVNAWLTNPSFDGVIPASYVKQFDDLIQEQFEYVTNKKKPPLDGYEPLGDIYNNQRIC